MAIAAFLSGAVFGLVLGDVGSTYNWPNSAMLPSESQGFNLIISILVSAAAGVVLGVSLTSTGGNALVGTAISAGLLPPIVNAGMLIAYSFTYCPKEKQAKFYEMGNYAIVFYATHVFTIVIVANFIFWLKNYDSRFKEGEDADFDDIPALVEHKKRLEAMGHGNIERAKAQYFIKNITDDLKGYALDAKDRAEGIASMVTGGLIQHKQRSRKHSAASSTQGGVGVAGDEDDLEAGRGTHSGAASRAGSNNIGHDNAAAKSALIDIEEDGPVHNPVHEQLAHTVPADAKTASASAKA
jgi:competence protein ComGC